MDDLRLERILRAVECVPAGHLATYGDIGKVCGERPRVVGWVLSQWGENVNWWRICNARGEIPGHAEAARCKWAEENIGTTPDGSRTLLADHRVDLTHLATAWEAAVAELPEDSTG